MGIIADTSDFRQKERHVLALFSCINIVYNYLRSSSRVSPYAGINSFIKSRTSGNSVHILSIEIGRAHV